MNTRFAVFMVLLSVITIPYQANTNHDTLGKTATLRALETPTPPATATIAIPVSCPPAEGYVWSRVFSKDTSYITEIFPLADGNFLIGGVVDANDGTWVAKINPKGEIVWQKKFLPAYADLQPAGNGNFLLRFQNHAIELDTNGNVVRSTDLPMMQPNADGSYTVVTGNRVMRYTDPEKPLWSYTIDNPDITGEPTTDGGAIYAYVGSYVDKSVYWMPIYTDLKVIKIDGNGTVRQHVYGKLVGDETLDRMAITADGGVLLAGTHYYEELGSDYDIWLMKINQSGGLSWQATLKSAPNMDSITSLFVLSKGYLVTSEDNVNNSLRLVKLTPKGALAWQKQVKSVRGSIDITTVADTSDGGLIISGQTQEKNGVGFLVRFSPKGELLWEKLTGFNGLDGTPDTFVETIFPMDDGNILLGGAANIVGQRPSDTYGAWLANIEDDGELLGFLTVSPGKFSVIKTMSYRPNNLPDEVVESDPIKIGEINIKVEKTSYQTFSACLTKGVSLPTPRALPTLAPSLTPTPGLKRNLYLTTPNYMQGADVLLLQQRLLELGYDEVGVADGIFGKKTQNAVRLFQAKNGLEVDGIVGLKTWVRLFSSGAIPNG